MSIFVYIFTSKNVYTWWMLTRQVTDVLEPLEDPSSSGSSQFSPESDSHIRSVGNWPAIRDNSTYRANNVIGYCLKIDELILPVTCRPLRLVEKWWEQSSWAAHRETGHPCTCWQRQSSCDSPATRKMDPILLWWQNKNKMLGSDGKIMLNIMKIPGERKGFSLLCSGSTFLISLYSSRISTSLTSNLSNDQIWFGLLVLRTSMAGSLISPIRFRLGLRLAGGIWRVTLKRVCLPSSSAKTLASRAKALARTISSRSWARLRRKYSSFSCAQRSDRPCPDPALPRNERLLRSSEENDDEGDMGESTIDERSCWKCRSYSWRCRWRARCLSSSCCFSSRAIAVCLTWQSRKFRNQYLKEEKN